MMKKIILMMAVIVIALTGCTKESNKKLELRQIVMDLCDSFITKDHSKIGSIFEEGVIDPYLIFQDTNYLACESIEEMVNGNEAFVKIKIEFEERMDPSTEFTYLIGLLTLNFHYTDGSWLVHNTESELDPSTTRPPRA